MLSTRYAFFLFFTFTIRGSAGFVGNLLYTTRGFSFPAYLVFESADEESVF